MRNLLKTTQGRSNYWNKRWRAILISPALTGHLVKRTYSYSAAAARFMRCGSTAMMARRCSGARLIHAAISVPVRPQPSHKPVTALRWQIFWHGLSKARTLLLISRSCRRTALLPSLVQGGESALGLLYRRSLTLQAQGRASSIITPYTVRRWRRSWHP